MREITKITRHKCIECNKKNRYLYIYKNNETKVLVCENCKVSIDKYKHLEYGNLLWGNNFNKNLGMLNEDLLRKAEMDCEMCKKQEIQK